MRSRLTINAGSRPLQRITRRMSAPPRMGSFGSTLHSTRQDKPTPEPQGLQSPVEEKTMKALPAPSSPLLSKNSPLMSSPTVPLPTGKTFTPSTLEETLQPILETLKKRDQPFEFEMKKDEKGGFNIAVSQKCDIDPNNALLLQGKKAEFTVTVTPEEGNKATISYKLSNQIPIGDNTPLPDRIFRHPAVTWSRIISAFTTAALMGFGAFEVASHPETVDKVRDQIGTFMKKFHENIQKESPDSPEQARDSPRF